MGKAELAIAVRGAGVVGLWQALTLAKRGHDVTLYERSSAPFAAACSVYAGAMLAPQCEEESAEAVIRELGLEGLALWREVFPGTVTNGSLVVAPPRDRVLLERFARMTVGHRRLSRDEIDGLEPGLSSRFAEALYFMHEGHVAPEPALSFLLEQASGAGAQVCFADAGEPRADLVIDCRGLAAKDDLPTLRGVRGERVVVESRDVALQRPVRLLHPRFPLYVVPWGDHRFMLGATVIESEEQGAASVRSALELLNAAYALDPAFSEAKILAIGAGARPAFPDNRPRIIDRGGYIYVNGLYRHGFLLAPVLAARVAAFLESGVTDPEVFVADPVER